MSGPGPLAEDLQGEVDRQLCFFFDLGQLSLNIVADSVFGHYGLKTFCIFDSTTELNKNLLHFKVRDENLMIVEANLIDEQNPFGKPLTVFEEKQIFVLHAIEESNDVFDLFLELILVHLNPELRIRIYRQEFFNRHCCFGMRKSLFDSGLVVGYKITN